MFSPGSRYYNLPTNTITAVAADGTMRQIRYVIRRFLPPADASGTLVQYTVAQGDRLDNIAARYIGDPTQFWRICDANNAMRPEELTERVGNSIRIAMQAV
jgi:nucleoid-associated protein YgaU